MAAKTATSVTRPVRNLKALALAPRPQKGFVPEAAVPGLGNVDYGVVDVGSWSSSVQLTVTGWSFGTSVPFLILAHPRQSQFTDNQNNGFPDQFSTQVIDTTSETITFLITRVDPGAEGQGWGQDLELDIFVIE